MLNKQLNILLIDDDPLNTFTMQRLIKKCSPNVSVKSFESGEKALSYFANLDKQDFPHIILLDLYMPEMDGWEFLEEYQKRGFETNSCTIYILSSSVDDRDTILAEEHGLVQEFLKKPLEREKLLLLLEHHNEVLNGSK